MLDKTSLEDKKILVLFNIEFLQVLVEERKINPENIYYIADNELEYLSAIKIFKVQSYKLSDFSVPALKKLIAGIDMKFDLVFSNPPYNKNIDIKILNEIFDIADDIKKIAVNVSGGADSAILLYMVADYLVKNNRTETTELNVLTCVNDFKGRWNARKAAAVIDFVIGRTGCPINMHYSYYRPTQDVKYFHEIERNLISRGDIDFIISGGLPIIALPLFTTMGLSINFGLVTIAIIMSESDNVLPLKFSFHIASFLRTKSIGEMFNN